MNLQSKTDNSNYCGIKKANRVEFIGLPGSGKSSIQTHLLNSLKLLDNKKYISYDEAFFHVSKKEIDRIYRFILKCIPNNLGLKLSKKLINRSYMQYDAQNMFLSKWGKTLESFLSSSIFNQMTIEDRELRISVLLNTGSVYECINESISENIVVFFDELFVQKSFIFVSHLINYNLVGSALYRYLEQIPISDIVIHVKANINTCYERMIYRERGVIRILKHCDHEDIMNFLKIADVHIKNIVQWLKQNTNCILLEIDSENDIENVVFDLVNKITNITAK